MDSFLQQRIKNFLDATGLTVSALERKAGLKLNVARNILTGQSKKPGAETLQAIADVMACNVSDLLGVKRETFQSDVRLPSDGTPNLENPELFKEAFHAILQMVQETHLNLTVRQILSVLEEGYLYAIKKDPPKLDLNFVKWFIERRFLN